MINNYNYVYPKYEKIFSTKNNKLSASSKTDKLFDKIKSLKDIQTTNDNLYSSYKIRRHVLVDPLIYIGKI